MLTAALAAKRNQGLVIAQVRSIREKEHSVPVHVKVPAAFIDAVVLDPNQGMTFLSPNEPALVRRDAPFDPEKLDLADVPRAIARRAADELCRGDFVNVGFGMSDGVPVVARQEGVIDSLTFLIEQGAIGGIPTTGLNFGAMYQPQAILDEAYQFDFFYGAGLDIAFLGFAQIDRNGNVNSSRFGQHITGCGGFIDISQHARRVVFCGSFAVKAQVEIKEGSLHIIDPGRKPKFVDQVQQVTFSGPYARMRDQQVLYVTERAVFRLTEEGVQLEEIAPGADLSRDILEKMDFSPIIPPDLKTMDTRYFRQGPVGLKEKFGL
jgi:propionate CoA-transferase